MRHLRTITRVANVLPAQLRPLTAPVVQSAGARRKVLGRVEGAVVDEHARVIFFVVRVHEAGRASRKRVLVPLPVVRSLELGRDPAIVIEWSRLELLARPDFADGSQIPLGAWRTGTSSSSVSESDGAAAADRVLPSAARWGAIAAASGALLGWIFWGAPAAFLTALLAGAVAASGAALRAALRIRSGGSGPGPMPWLRTLEEELRKSAPFESGILREATIGPLLGTHM